MASYVRHMWRGELPFSRVFWTDMLVVGTLVNVAAFFAMLAAFKAGAPGWLAFSVHFLPVPYNILLFMGVSRSAAVIEPNWAWVASMLAGIWFVVMLFV